MLIVSFLVRHAKMNPNLMNFDNWRSTKTQFLGKNISLGRNNFFKFGTTRCIKIVFNSSNRTNKIVELIFQSSKFYQTSVSEKWPCFWISSDKLRRLPMTRSLKKEKKNKITKKKNSISLYCFSIFQILPKSNFWRMFLNS